MAPELTVEQRLEYVKAEQGFIEELMEDAEDCKWVYQGLIECALIEAKLAGQLSDETNNSIRGWLGKLKKLDPLRIGRWKDTEAMLLDENS